MSQQSHTPSDVQIHPRNREHDIADCLGRDWLGDKPFRTAWANALSITFPLGEKFFIDSVRHYADQITDPQLQAEISGFCGQEGFHRREHERYNRTLCQQRGYDLDYLEGRIEKKIAKVNKILPPIQRLAATAALEHLTAIMAEQALDEATSIFNEAEPPMKALWQWHAAEEMEHKAVAFDVYRAVGGEEAMRKSALRRATFFLSLDALIGTLHMLKKDGNLFKLSVWREGFEFLFGKQGMVRRIAPSYREYFRDGFHPWQQDTRPLLEAWQRTELESATPAT